MKMKRVISSILCVLMLISSFVFTASAESSTATKSEIYASRVTSIVAGSGNMHSNTTGSGVAPAGRQIETAKDGTEFMSVFYQYQESNKNVADNKRLGMSSGAVGTYSGFTADNTKVVTIASLVKPNQNFMDYLVSIEKRTTADYTQTAILYNSNTKASNTKNAAIYEDENTGYTLAVLTFTKDDYSPENLSAMTDTLKHGDVTYYGMSLRTQGSFDYMYDYLNSNFGGRTAGDFSEPILESVGNIAYMGDFSDEKYYEDIISDILYDSRLTSSNTYTVTYDYPEGTTDKVVKYPVPGAPGQAPITPTTFNLIDPEISGFVGWQKNGEGAVLAAGTQQEIGTGTVTYTYKTTEATAEYFLSPTGVDTADGTTVDTPVKTIKQLNTLIKNGISSKTYGANTVVTINVMGDFDLANPVVIGNENQGTGADLFAGVGQVVIKTYDADTTDDDLPTAAKLFNSSYATTFGTNVRFENIHLDYASTSNYAGFHHQGYSVSYDKNCVFSNANSTHAIAFDTYGPDAAAVRTTPATVEIQATGALGYLYFGSFWPDNSSRPTNNISSITADITFDIKDNGVDEALTIGGVHFITAMGSYSNQYAEYIGQAHLKLSDPNVTINEARAAAKYLGISYKLEGYRSIEVNAGTITKAYISSETSNNGTTADAGHTRIQEASGVAVLTVNGGTVGTVANVASDAKDISKRIVINNGGTITAMEDTDAIYITSVTGGKLSADVDYNATTYTATFKGFNVEGTTNKTAVFTAEDGTKSYYAIESGKIAAADLVAGEYTVEFTNDNLIVFDPDYPGATKIYKVVEAGVALGENLPAAPVRDGFSFKGWKDEEENDVNAETIATEGAVYTAVWGAIDYIAANDSPLTSYTVGAKPNNHGIGGPGLHNATVSSTNYEDKDNFDYIHSVVKYNDSYDWGQQYAMKRVIINPSLTFTKTTDNVTVAFLANYDNAFNDFLDEKSAVRTYGADFYGVTGSTGSSLTADAYVYDGHPSGYTLYLLELGVNVGKDFTKFTSVQFNINKADLKTLFEEYAANNPNFELFDYVGYAIYDGLFDETAANSDDVADSIVDNMLSASKVTDANTLTFTYDYNDEIADETECYPNYTVLNALPSASKTYTLKAPTIVPGFVHEGWYADAQASGEAVTSVEISDQTANTTYYAKLTPGADVDLTITTVISGVSQDSFSTTVPYNTYVKDIEKPSIQGKFFQGWYSDDSCTSAVSDDTLITQATSLYAKMGDFSHSITLYRNIDNADTEKVVVTVSDGSGLADNDYPTWVQNKSGWVYRITSWNTKADGTGTEMPDTFTAPDENVMNLSYYAQWEKETTLSADSKSVFHKVWQDKHNLNTTGATCGANKYSLTVDENGYIYADVEITNTAKTGIGVQSQYTFSEAGNATIAFVTDQATHPATASVQGIDGWSGGQSAADFKHVYSYHASEYGYYIHLYAVDKRKDNTNLAHKLNIWFFNPFGGRTDIAVGSKAKYVGMAVFNGRLSNEDTTTNTGLYDNVASSMIEDILGYAKATSANSITVNYNYGDIQVTDKYVNESIRAYYNDFYAGASDVTDTVIRSTSDDPTGGYIEAIDGWYDNSSYTGTKVDAATVVSEGDSTTSAPIVRNYYANVTLKKINVTFNANGGEGQEETVEYSYGDTVATKTYPAFTRDGVSPLGFATSANATEYIAIADFDATKVTEDVTYYAIWPTPYKITFYDEDGETVLTQFNDYNGSFTYEPEDRPGLMLEGWYVNDAQTVTAHPADNSFTVSADTKYVAKYTVTNLATYVLDGKYTPAKGEYEVKLYFVGDDNVEKLSFGYQWNKSEMTLVSVTAADIVNVVSEIHTGDIDADKAGYSATYTMAEGTPINAADGKVLLATFAFTMDETQRAAFIASNNYFDQYIDADTEAGLFEGDSFKCFYVGDTTGANVINTSVYEIIDERLYIKDFSFTVSFNGKKGPTQSGKEAIIEYRVNGEGEFAVLAWTDDIAGGENADSKSVLLPEYTAVEGEKLEIRICKPGYLSDEVVVDTLEAGSEIVIAPQAGDIKGNAADTYGDGVIDFNDYMRVVNAFTDALKENTDYCKDVDIDEDGAVTVFDLNIIKDYLANN